MTYSYIHGNLSFSHRSSDVGASRFPMKLFGLEFSRHEPLAVGSISYSPCSYPWLSVCELLLSGAFIGHLYVVFFLFFFLLLLHHFCSVSVELRTSYILRCYASVNHCILSPATIPHYDLLSRDFCRSLIRSTHILEPSVNHDDWKKSCEVAENNLTFPLSP